LKRKAADPFPRLRKLHKRWPLNSCQILVWKDAADPALS
jgi:hypothetical protein